MSRRRPSREQLAPSMFPFLAVLLCTMGALVLMLILMVSQARASARRKAQEKSDELQQTIDQVTVSSDEFENEFRRNAEEMQMQQERLARVEDHIRRITEELTSLREKFVALEEIEKENAKTREEQIETDAEIESLREQIDERKQELEEQLAEQKKQQKAFAIVPYSGTNGTARRPIYLECRNDGVVIQPEGILLTFDDLKPPFNTGNPLDASLRLIRSELLQAQLTNSVYSNAYPLLLVRPDGIRAYTIARAAMKNWDDQFGYELISQKMPLVFPKSLPGLTPKLRQTILEARQRQTALVQSLPPSMRRAIDDAALETEPLQRRDPIDRNRSGLTLEKFGEELGSSWRSIDTLSSSPQSRSNGPIALASGNSIDGSQLSPSQFDLSSAPKLASGDWQFSEIPGGSRTSSIPGNLGSAFGSSSSFEQDSSGGEFQPTRNGFTNLGSVDSSLARGNRNNVDTNQIGGFDSGNATAASELSVSNISQFSNLAGNSTTGTEQSNIAAAQSNSGGAGSQPSGGSSNSGSSGSDLQQSAGQNSSSASGASLAASQSNPSNQPPPLSFGYQNRPPADSGQLGETASAASNTGGSPGGSSGSTSRGDAIGGQGSGGGQRFGAARANSRNAVVRHISIYVTNDRWYVLTETNPPEIEEIIDLQQGPSASRRALVETLQSRVDSWGQASQGGYWQPVLNAKPADGTDVGIQRLRSLLKGSNVDLIIDGQPEANATSPSQ